MQLAAARLVLPDGVTGPGTVVVEDGLVADIVLHDGPAPDRTIAPGFVDLQVNGIDAVDVASADGDDWDVLDRALLAHGVTTWCPTLVTAPLDAFAAPLARVAAARARVTDHPRPSIAGAHLEGPFLGGAPGAHPRALLRDPDAAFLDDLPDVVALVTLAPEREGALDAVASLARHGVLVSLGHSTATYEQTEAAIDAGARLVTHCFNGMGLLHHREPGIVGAALTDDRVAASVIADLVHVHPAAVQLVFRAKGADGVVLVTDSVAWDRGTIGRVRTTFDGVAPRLADGTLAGSALTMHDAVRAASTTPARLLGLRDRGALAPGLRADLVVLSPELAVTSTWVAGELAAGHSG